nr:hypothetical protein HmN_000286900 [Hymenolepis microstoma]
MLLTGEMGPTAVNDLNQTCPLIYPLVVQPQSPSSYAQSIIPIIIGCAVGIGIALIRKLIGESLQRRTITFAEVQDIPNRDYEKVEVINLPASTGIRAILRAQDNKYYFHMKVSVLQTFAVTPGVEDSKY